MGRNLDRYTKVQLVLYRIFEVVVFILSLILLYNLFCVKGCLISIIVSSLALLSSVLIIINSKWVNVVRLAYLLLYAYEAYKFEHYVDMSIKLFILIPMCIYTLIKIFPNKSIVSWMHFINKERLKMLHVESKYTVLSFGIFLGVLSFILTQIFSQYVKVFDDNTLSGAFLTALTLSGFMFGWYNKNRSIVKWPYGLIYHVLVFYMWYKTPHHFAMDIYCIFWIIYTILGCIEAYYIREFELDNPSIFIIDYKDMEKRRNRKNKAKNNKF